MTKVCFITGGSSGIGAQCARDLAKKGYKIAIADINEALGIKLVEELEAVSGKGNAYFLRCNVMDGQSVRSAITKTVELYERLDIAINCAGITGGKLVPIHEMTEEEYDLVNSIDARGMFLCLKEEIRAMRAQETIGQGARESRGIIVNVASRAGLEGVPTFGAYCAAKHAVIGLTKVAALENAESKIRVNSICPGLITTPGHTSDPTHKDLDAKLAANVPMQRWGEPVECTDCILFLVSDSSSFMTGAILEVDGGMAARSR